MISLILVSSELIQNDRMMCSLMFARVEMLGNGGSEGV